MRAEPAHVPYISSGIRYGLQNLGNPFDTGGLENMSQADVAQHANVRFKPNHGAPTYEVAQQSDGEIFEGWSVKNHAPISKKYPFIKFVRTPAKEEGKSVGDKFHISVAPKDMPKAFDVISKLISSETARSIAGKPQMLTVSTQETHEYPRAHSSRSTPNQIALMAPIAPSTWGKYRRW